MENMLERVARALCDSGMGSPEWRDHVEAARAAIGAMREPSGGMQADGRDALLPYVGALKQPVTDQWQLARDVWRAMIDAALKAPSTT